MRRAVIALIVLASALLLGVWFKQCIVVDSCYDNGGYWSKEEQRCIGERGALRSGDVGDTGIAVVREESPNST